MRTLSDAHHALPAGQRAQEVLHDIGVNSLVVGWIDDADHTLKDAREIDSAAGDPWNGLGLVANERGSFEDAARLFERAGSCSPKPTM